MKASWSFEELISAWKLEIQAEGEKTKVFQLGFFFFFFCLIVVKYGLSFLRQPIV